MRTYALLYDHQGQHGTLATFHSKKQAVKAMKDVCEQIKPQGGSVWIEEHQTSTDR